MRDTITHHRLRRRYRIEATASMAAYAIVIAAVLLWLRAHPLSPWRPVAALLPLIPLAAGIGVVVRVYRGSDERARRIQVEALAFAFLVSAPATVTYGFLESAGLPRLSAWWYWIAMGLGWALGRIILSRRYG